MTEEEMEEAFAVSGHYHLFRKLRYPIYISGEMDEVDSSVLESFFSWYSFDEDHPVFFDDFIYHFRIFRMLEKRNILPEVF